MTREEPEETGEATERVEALLGQLDTTADPADRARILVEVGATFRDGLGDPAQAIDAFLEAWEVDPTNDVILDELEPLVRTKNRWPELLEQTGGLATTAESPQHRLVYHEAMVRWLTTDVPNPELARAWVERVRSVDPTHALVHVFQAALSREHGDYKRELDELDLAVLSTRRKDERVRIHLVLASRFLEPRSLNRAMAKKHYEQAHRLLPKMMEPLVGLEQIAQGDTVALADVLRRQADADIGENEAISIYRRLARLEEAEFRRPELAARTLERLIARMTPDSVEYDGVLDELERCYRAARMWPELLAVLERAAITDADAAKRAARLRRLGDVLESKLGDIRAALTTYQRLAGLMPDDETVITELARLAEKASEVTLAVNSRERLAELTSDPIASARHNVIAGQLMMPIDAVAARRYFERAVASDPSNAVAWNALLWDARSSGEQARVASYLETRAHACEAPRLKAGHFVELAEHRARSGDRAGERAAYVRAILADPANESAANALLEPFVEEGRHREAEVIAEVVIAAAERDKDVPRSFTARRAQTQIGFALDKPDLALRAALAAFDVRREDRQARTDLVRAASQLRADPLVLSARGPLAALADDAEGLDVDVRVTLAEVLALVGESDRAVSLFEDALVERPDDERALVGLAQQYALAGNKAAALRLRRQMALGIADPGLRLTTLLEVGDALAKIDEDELAADVYESARALAKADLAILHKLLALYQRLVHWAKLFDVLRAIVDVDTDPHRRAKTLFTMGQIASTELLDRGTALEMFDRALDVDPSRLEAFENIVRILEDGQDWLGLEEMYRKMLARADAANDGELTALLGKQLAKIYRDKLGDVRQAAITLEGVIRVRPGDEAAHEQLAALLASIGQASGAAAVTLDRVLREPMNPRPYPALFDFLMVERSYDRALCVASAMHFLDIRHPPADALRQQHRSPPLPSIIGGLGPDGYERLLHPELDRGLTEIFAIVAPAVIDLVLSRLSFRARMRHPGPNLRGHDDLARAVGSAARILGLPTPKLFLRVTPGPVLAPATTRPPGLMVYPQALLGVPDQVLAFKVGKRVLELTPPLLVRALCPSVSELEALRSSAARIATGAVESGDLPLRDRLKKDDLARLGAVVTTSMGAGGKLDVLRWSQLADLSASYGGLLLAGDLESARAALATDPQSPGDLSPREKMRELVAWFLGDTSAALRSSLA